MIETSLDDVQAFTVQLSPFAHLATVRANGTPDVAPVAPAWKDGLIWVAARPEAVKMRNVAGHPKVAIHWQVGPEGDGVEVWGTGRVLDSLEWRRELWTGVFSYDLGHYVPEGPEAPGMAFLEITPRQAVILLGFGERGRMRWKASASRPPTLRTRGARSTR